MASSIFKCFTSKQLFNALKVSQQNQNSLSRCIFYNTFTTEINPNRENKLKNVYYGVLTPQIKAVKVFSLTTSVGGLAAQPLIFSHSANLDSFPLLIGICSFVGFFTFVTPFLLHTMTKKYITHLDYDELKDEYTATVVTFFLTNKKIKFTPEDVHVPDVPGMFTSFLAKGTPLFVDPRMFPDTHHYARIMGYDKPIDLKLNEPISDIPDNKKH